MYGSVLEDFIKVKNTLEELKLYKITHISYRKSVCFWDIGYLFVIYLKKIETSLDLVLTL